MHMRSTGPSLLRFGGAGLVGMLAFLAWSVSGTSTATAAPSPGPSGGIEVAFQANTGMLSTVGNALNKSNNLHLKAGSSPSITALPGGGYEVAFEADTGTLWTVGSAGNRNW